jgi:hypothetical protein
MARNIVFPGRAVFALAVLCVLVLGQSTALAGLCEGDHVPNHCCLLCQTGALPMLQAAVSLAVAPTLYADWLTSNRSFETIHNLLRTTSSPRAPPFSNPSF